VIFFSVNVTYLTVIYCLNWW